MKRSVSVHLSELALQSLGAGEGRAGGEDVSAKLELAVRVYLHDSDLDRPGWALPPPLRGREARGAEVDLAVDESLWHALEREAEGQGVSASHLAAQAAIYYAAELDAGRITERILDELDAGSP